MTLPILFFSSLLATIHAAPSTSTSAQAATAFSLEYGFPIAAWQMYAGIAFEGGAKPNKFQNTRQVANSNDTIVVKLNVDTLYSKMIYDLSASDVELILPDVPQEQFKLFSFFDVFGDNYASVGTGTFYEPGQYLLTSQARSGGKRGFKAADETYDGEKNKGVITAPSVYGTIIVRWLVNQTNVPAIHQWQDQTSSKTIPSKAIAPSLVDVVGTYKTSENLLTNVMNLIPYYIPTGSSKSEFELAGIDFASDKWTQPKSVNLGAANATAIGAIAAAAQSPKFNLDVGNGWTVLSPEYMGTYGMEYAFRAFVAENTYLGNSFPYSLYPSWTNTSSSSASSGTVDVSSDEALLFTFSGLPLLKEDGFWSLTLYNGSFVLISNPLNRYALGDRSNLTYPDGKPVYFGSANYPNTNDSGAFQILVQASNVKPPGNWTSNWLPAPAGGGEIVPELRWYNAKKAMYDGGYVYPTVEKIAAIKG